jgi:hypothetical protein
MNIIIYTRPDGGVGIVHPNISQNDPPGFSEADALARALAKDIPADATNVRVVDPAAIPADRSKRIAWRQIGDTIVIDAIISADLSSRLARRTIDESERLSGKADSAVMALINQTKAEWITWVTTNLSFCVTPADRNRMGTLFWIVALAVRGLLRNGGG